MTLTENSDQNSPCLWCIRIHLLYINLIYGHLQHCSILTEQLHPTVGDKCLLLIKVKAIYSINDRRPKPWVPNLSFRHVVQNANREGFLQNSIIQPVLMVSKGAAEFSLSTIPSSDTSGLSHICFLPSPE